VILTEQPFPLRTRKSDVRCSVFLTHITRNSIPSFSYFAKSRIEQRTTIYTAEVETCDVRQVFVVGARGGRMEGKRPRGHL
jgi:hypothetical protein